MAPSMQILANRPHVVMCLVHRGPNEIVHACIDDHERLCPAPLEIKHARDQDTCIADDEATGLEYQGAFEIACGPLDECGISLRVGRGLVAFPVGNSKASA